MTVTARYFDGLEATITKACLKLRGSFEPEGGPHAREPGVIRWFLNEAMKHENPVVLDIGACTGSYALLSKFHNMRIFSFEPTRRTYDQLCKNVKLNELEKKTIALPFAVGAKEEKTTFHEVIHDSCAALSMLGGRPANHKETEPVQVHVVTVDAFCARRNIKPKLMKIDTEGGELNVLKGAMRIIRECHPTILCEYSRPNTAQYGYNPEKIAELLKREGYHCTVEGPELFATWGK